VDWERVGEVLDAVNSQWALPILRTLASGVSRPSDLLRAVGRGLSPKVMYDTLARLAQDDLVSRTEVEGVVPRETHYWPTREGHRLLNELSKLGVPRWPATGYEDPSAPPGVDPSVPNTARVWNALVGGKDHFAADRKVVSAFVAEMPSLPEAARLARRFQGDAVRRLIIDHGVRQFLDIGTGLPVAGSVHEVAQRQAAESRVVYVDNDPQVLAHGRALLRSRPEGATAVVQGDIREPGAILARAAETLDLSQPVAVITMMVLHFLPDADDPWGIIRRLIQGIRADAYLILGHAGADIAPAPAQAAAARYNESSAQSLRLRPHSEVMRFFSQAGLETLTPGLVPLARWWPGEPGLPQDANAYVGVGRRAARRGPATP
jgi:DNA-binding HxlR family transcriptional regulator